MAEQNIVHEDNILDFSSLGEVKKFRFKDNVYMIPPITPAMTEDLVGMQSDLANLEKKRKEENQDDAEANVEFMKASHNMIHATVKHEDGSEITWEHFRTEWPVALMTKVLELVMNTMSGAVKVEDADSKNA
jgi:hypothetical protein